jgi:predicted ATP-binding protein involved in virulence
MTPNTLLRLDQLSVRNFRCFAECTVDLHPKLTVLVAENGQGKTAILDAINVAFGPYVDALAGTGQSKGFARTDIRLSPGEGGRMKPELPTEFVGKGVIADEPVRWSRSRRSDSSKANSTQGKANEIVKPAQALRHRVEISSGAPGTEIPILPLIAFYGTGRLRGEQATRRKSFLPPNARLAGYAECLSSSLSESAGRWYETKWNETRDPRFSAELTNNLRLLGAVRQAIDEIIGPPTGWRNFEWDAEQKTLVVENSSQGRLPLRALSDGVRGMLAVIADIARRCATLNPQFLDDAARATPGLLLIDEVDMHLHPRWQQVVVDLLGRAFPLLQVILTTHSPHVLSTVHKDSIRVIRLRDGRGLIETPTMQTRGVMSADVLASIMGVDPIPQIEEAQQLSQYRALIEDGLAESEEALPLRSGLVAHFGENHPLILDCDRLIRFQAFKLKRNRPEEV